MILSLGRLYIPWMLLSIPLSLIGIFNLPDEFIYYKRKNFFSNQSLRLITLFLIFCSFITSAIYLDMTVIPSFILISFLSAYYYKKNFYTYNKFFKLLAYLGSFVIFIKYFVLGFDTDSLFLFSKNILFLSFVPYIYSFYYQDSKKLNSLIDYFVLIGLIMMFVLTLSVSNLVFTIFIVISLLSPNNIGINSLVFSKNNFKLKIVSRYLAFLGIILLPFKYIIKIFSESMIELEYIGFVPKLLRPIWTGQYEGTPRLDILIDYFDFENFRQFIFGKHIESFEYFDLLKDTSNLLSNPHNSIVILHNTCGIFGLMIFIILIISSLKVLFKYSISQGIFLLAILLRSSSDSILVATGVSAFIIYTSLFDKQINNIKRINV